MEKSINFIKKNYKNFLIALLILIITTMIIQYSKKTNSSELENISYISTVISLLFISWQVKIAVKDYKVTNDRLRIDKAIELSRYYESDILPLINIISCVFNRIEINKLVCDIKEEDMVEFDIDELNNIAPEDIADVYNEMLKSKECIKAYKDICYLTETGNKTIVDELFNFIHNDPDEESENNILDLKSVISFNIIITDALNKLEYFAMNFTHNIADEKVVYQSLHQTYRGTVKLLYIRIASVNKDPKNKYFTNIIELFNLWNQRYFEILEKEKKNKKESIYKRNALNT